MKVYIVVVDHYRDASEVVEAHLTLESAIASAPEQTFHRDGSYVTNRKDCVAQTDNRHVDFIYLIYEKEVRM
jgi:hypothetical protein